MNLSHTLRFMFVISKFYCCRVKTGSLRDVFQGHSGLGFRVPHPHPPLLSVHRVPHRTEPSRFIYIYFFFILPRALIILFSSFLPLRSLSSWTLRLRTENRNDEGCCKQGIAALKAMFTDVPRICEHLSHSLALFLSYYLSISPYIYLFISVCVYACLRKRDKKCAREPGSER